jgi:hypothetical protein
MIESDMRLAVERIKAKPSWMGREAFWKTLTETFRATLAREGVEPVWISLDPVVALQFASEAQARKAAALLVKGNLRDVEVEDVPDLGWCVVASYRDLASR